MLKLMMIQSLSLFVISAFALPTQKNFVNSYREELKDMASENHDALTSYSTSRKYIMQKVHLKKDHLGFFVKDVYCNIVYRTKISPNTMPSANFINIEHTWPRSRFSSKKGSKKYNRQLSDLHHLYPTDSRTNSVRGNLLFTQFSRGGQAAGKNCQSSKVGKDPKTGVRAFEPPAEHKGDVARALFYMAVRYDERISDHEEFILRQWHIMDPVDEKELERNDKIEQIQGNRNPFVDDPDLIQLVPNL
jgi:endonuclease I